MSTKTLPWNWQRFTNINKEKGKSFFSMSVNISGPFLVFDPIRYRVCNNNFNRTHIDIILILLFLELTRTSWNTLILEDFLLHTCMLRRSHDLKDENVDRIRIFIWGDSGPVEKSFYRKFNLQLLIRRLSQQDISPDVIRISYTIDSAILNFSLHAASFECL